MSDMRIEEEEGAAPPAEGELTAKQELALSAVISHPTLKEAAASSGVSETTLWRYMKEEAFARRLSEARRDAVNHAAVRLQQASGDAVTVLQELMLKDGAPASARTMAARIVLDYSFRVVEMDEMKRRIRELEEFLIRKQETDEIDRALLSEEGE